MKELETVNKENENLKEDMKSILREKIQNEKGYAKSDSKEASKKCHEEEMVALRREHEAERKELRRKLEQAVEEMQQVDRDKEAQVQDLEKDKEELMDKIEELQN